MKNRTLGTLAVIGALGMNMASAANVAELRILEPQALVPTIDPVLVNPTLKEPDVTIFTARNHYFKRAITSTKPQVTRSEKFVPLKGAKTYITVPAGKNVLVNTAFTAESRCSEPGSSASNWCEVSIRVGGKEAYPKASTFPADTYAFDSTDNGTETNASWESHAMDRHMCVNNAKGKKKKKVPVQVFWKVTNFDAGSAPNFWLDDWSFTVQLARGCRQVNKKFD